MTDVTFAARCRVCDERVVCANPSHKLLAVRCAKCVRLKKDSPHREVELAILREMRKDTDRAPCRLPRYKILEFITEATQYYMPAESDYDKFRKMECNTCKAKVNMHMVIFPELKQMESCCPDCFRKMKEKAIPTPAMLVRCQIVDQYIPRELIDVEEGKPDDRVIEQEPREDGFD